MEKIAIIGHRRNILTIVSVLKHHFKEIDFIHFEMNDFAQLDATLRHLNEALPHLDGLFYTGPIPYNLIRHRLTQTLPSVFIAHDHSNLHCTLLEATTSPSLNIHQLSIDGYTKEAVYGSYLEFGLEADALSLFIAPHSVYDETSLEDLYEFHKDLHDRQEVSFTITCISYIYEKLVTNGYPSLLIKPTSETIQHTFKHLDLELRSLNSSESQIVVISIEIDMPSEYNMILENEYQLLLEKTHVSEEIYRFAEKIQGTVVETGTHNYILFSTRKPVTDVTNQLQSLPLLQAIQINTAHTVSIGIGFGSTARLAKYNASIGLNKSLKNGGNQAHIVKNNLPTGPLYGNKSEASDSKPIVDSQFQVIADITGISLNTIYRLHCIVDQAKKKLFTSNELADAFGTSSRSMNRLIAKLENHGYVTIEGKKIIGGAGRPTRILKLLI